MNPLLEVLAITVGLGAVFVLFDTLHDRWAMRAAIKETDAQFGIEEQAAEQGISVEQLLCKHEWNQSEGEADESGGRIYCLLCGLDGDA